MTTKAKALKYRSRPGTPLVEGVDPAAIREATLTQMHAAQVAAAAAVAQRAPGPDPARAAAPASAPASAPAPPLSGDVASAAQVDSETQIAAIRREGLTGRQLRMARRVAHKHGLGPTSDFDAVRLLRAKGIDPFSRANMLDIVKSAPDEGGTAPRNLPTPVSEPPAPAVAPPAMPGLKLPEDRAGEIFRIQQDIARRRRRKTGLLLARLAFFVLLPTLVAGWYFNAVATPMYATHSEFVIQQADGGAGGGIGGLFRGTGLAVQQDSTTVQSYLQSRDAMLRLDADGGYKDHFSQDWIDPIQKLPPEASNEAAYRLYSRNVQVAFDPTEGILKMEVVAATPEASQQFSEALIGYAEEQVDNLTARLRDDQMDGAMENFEQAEARVREAQERVLALQERLGVLDPVSETGSLMQQITTFEVELRQKQLELQQLLSNTRPSEARVQGVEGEIERLEALIAELRGSMTASTDGATSLARVSGELRIAEADLATRQLLLQQAAQQLETARIEANRQTRYMAIGVSPVAPDEPTYPRAFENTALAFVIFAGIYLMLSLTASVLREQVSS